MDVTFLLISCATVSVLVLALLDAAGARRHAQRRSPRGVHPRRQVLGE